MKRTYHYVEAVFFILLTTWTIVSCSNAKKLTAAEKQYAANVERIKVLADMRNQFPCDTITKAISSTDTVEVFGNIDTIFTPGEASIVTKYKTITKTITITNTVVDRSEVQSARDSIDNLSFLLDAAIQSNDSCVENTLQLNKKVASLTQYKGIFIGLIVFSSLFALFFALKAFKLF